MKIDKGTLLQGGKYEILKILGEGGFGITYLAIQKSLNRQVAIKEFFMKDYCQRDSETTFVSMGTDSSCSMVELFKKKFIKEAQTISNLPHENIIRILDVFEENNTAYYVMEYHTGGDLSERIPEGGMDEQQAIGYIRRIADALDYIHQNNVLHLDIKPQNILFNDKDVPVLIDFGVAKHYDAESGGETSDTPVPLSEGFAPLEQYENEGVKDFSPATDIYALGATLFNLLTGHRPPSASRVLNGGLPALPPTISAQTVEAIKKAMKPCKLDRFQDVQSFLDCLLMTEEVDEDDETVPVKSESKKNPLVRYCIIAVIAIALVCIVLKALEKKPKNEVQETRTELMESPKTTYAMTGEQSSSNVTKTDNEASYIPPSQSIRVNIMGVNSFIDLGLSVLWSIENTESAPEEEIVYASDMLPTHYYWGQNIGSLKKDFTIENCETWDDGSLRDISGNIKYDPCCVIGGRLPRIQEVSELISVCKWEWVNYEGVEGYKVTGPNGNSIFLAADGQKANKEHLFRNERGCYQTSESDNGKACWILQFDRNGMKIAPSMRYQGNSIRAVRDK